MGMGDDWYASTPSGCRVDVPSRKGMGANASTAAMANGAVWTASVGVLANVILLVRVGQYTPMAC